MCLSLNARLNLRRPLGRLLADVLIRSFEVSTLSGQAQFRIGKTALVATNRVISHGTMRACL